MQAMACTIRPQDVFAQALKRQRGAARIPKPLWQDVAAVWRDGMAHAARG